MWDWNHQGTIWRYYVCSILRQYEIQIPDTLSSVSVDPAFTLSLVEEKLFHTHKNIWAMNLSNQSKLRMYATYKYEYAVKPYMIANLSRCQRSLIARLRSGTLPFKKAIMSFRLFHKSQDRLCKFCNAVEDENDFVFECKLFENRRHSFFSALDINFLTLSWDLK